MTETSERAKQAPRATSKDAWIVTAEQWGRVEADGTVWVRTSSGERVVGQYPGATPEEALAYFARKFDDLLAQVTLFEQRITAGQVSPADAESGVQRLRDSVVGANAVGDLDALATRVGALTPLAQQRRAEEEQARAAARERAFAQRAVLVEEAEAIAAVDINASRGPPGIVFANSSTSGGVSPGTRLDKPQRGRARKRYNHARTTPETPPAFGALDSNATRHDRPKPSYRG
jgi:hypothetical protein